MASSAPNDNNDDNTDSNNNQPVKPKNLVREEECDHCHTLVRDLAAGQKLSFCSGCRQKKYCCRACQMAAWRAGQ